MESKNIIIILVVIIAVLGLVLGVMFFQTANAKEPTKVKITSNNTLYEGKDLTLKLTDLNKTPIAKEKVNITIKNSKGKVVANKTVKTNEKGNAKLDLNLKKGKYTVDVAYGGNENYTGNNTTQKLIIKEEVRQTVSEESSSSSADSGDYSSSSPNSDLAAKAEDAGIGYTYSDDGEVFINEAEYAEHAARTGDTW